MNYTNKELLITLRHLNMFQVRDRVRSLPRRHGKFENKENIYIFIFSKIRSLKICLYHNLQFEGSQTLQYISKLFDFSSEFILPPKMKSLDFVFYNFNFSISKSIILSLDLCCKLKIPWKSLLYSHVRNSPRSK